MRRYFYAKEQARGSNQLVTIYDAKKKETHTWNVKRDEKGLSYAVVLTESKRLKRIYLHELIKHKQA